MKTINPAYAKSTKTLLKALPPEFKLVKEEESNGFKYINMLAGIEIDEIKDRIKSLYDSFFIDTIDLSESNYLYAVELSGSANYSGYLNSEIVPIKITNEDEFYNGTPTRLKYNDILSVTGLNPIVGINYFRRDTSGSGYLLISYDLEQGSGYSSEQFTNTKIDLSPTGAILSYSGYYPGIRNQNYNDAGFDEIIEPISISVLSGQYPVYRQLLISGVIHSISHYEPYRGWTYDQNGTVVAVNDYGRDFYYDEDGNKVFHRTYLNNPFGSGNYTKQFFPLIHIPISGTLTLSDIDILDISGVASPIVATGTPIYQLQYSGSEYEPIYKGYSSVVPSSAPFNYMQGYSASLLTTTSWGYEHVGSELDQQSGVWYSPTSGPLTNLISITNPQSRYVVEYSWEQYKKTKYITSLNATNYLNLDSTTPVFSLENNSGNLVSVPFKFTRNPSYIVEKNGVKVNEQSKILTFDGWNIRPNSRIHKLSFNIPIHYQSTLPLAFFEFPFTHDYIGYSNEFVPQVNTIRDYEINCIFNTSIKLHVYSSTDSDLTSNGHTCTYSSSGHNRLYSFPYENTVGKKILYFDSESYYNVDNPGILKDNTFFKFVFKPMHYQNIQLMELSLPTSGNYLFATINNEGKLFVEMSGYTFVSKDNMIMDRNSKELIIQYHKDYISQTVPVINVFMRDKKTYMEKIPMWRKASEITTLTSDYLHIFKNCSIDIGQFQVYYEAF